MCGAFMRLTWRCAVRYHEPVATPDVRLDQLRNMISTASHEFSKSYFQAREEELYPESYGDEYKRKVTRMHTILYVALLAATATVWIVAFTVTSATTQATFLKMALGPFGALIRYVTSLYNKRPSSCGSRVLCNVATWHFPLCVCPWPGGLQVQLTNASVLLPAIHSSSM